MLCKHFFAVLKAGKETFQDVSPIFRSHPLHLIDNEIFDHQLYKDDNVLQAPNEEERMQGEYSVPLEPEDDKQIMVPLTERCSFKKLKGTLCSNVKALHEQCYNIKGNVLFVQEVNEKVTELVEALSEHLQQENGLLVDRPSPTKRKHSNLSYQQLPSRKKVKEDNLNKTAIAVMIG